MRDEIENLYKFPNNNILKIKFKQATIVKRATEQGLLAYNMSIPEHNIKIEKYIPVNICMKWCELDSHYTSNCPKGDFKVCSECASSEHMWKDQLHREMCQLRRQSPHIGLQMSR